MSLENGSQTDRSSSPTRQDYLDLLHKYKLEIAFVKKDGSDRVMLCTLRSDLLPPYDGDGGSTKKPDEANLTVWDIESQGFRKIQISTIKSVQVMI